MCEGLLDVLSPLPVCVCVPRICVFEWKEHIWMPDCRRVSNSLCDITAKCKQQQQQHQHSTAATSNRFWNSSHGECVENADKWELDSGYGTQDPPSTAFTATAMLMRPPR